MTQGEMLAVVIRETGQKGDWNSLQVDKVPRPSPGPGEALIQVEACSVNRADLLQRRGLYPPPPGASTVMGLDFAGTVVQAPEGSRWGTGDRVFGIAAGGGYGRFLTVPQDHLVEAPRNLTFIEAAAVAEVFFTAYLNLYTEASLRKGETLLVHGGGSGVGTAAIQLAIKTGARVITTAGTPDKVRRCLELGATWAINYKEEDFDARVMQLTGGEGVDVILDWIGASYLPQHIEILKSRGRLVIIGLMGGTQSGINLAQVLTKRLRIIGSVLRSRSIEEKTALAEGFRRDVLPLLESGEARPIIHQVFPIEQVEQAHAAMREGKHFGKIVLSWSPL